MAIWKRAGRVASREIYTRFATELAAGRDPGPALVEPLLARLRDDLVREIRRRSLWHLSPSYLGIHGHRAWSQPEDARCSGALDELLLEAFTDLFVNRLEALHGYLRVGSSIDGLIPHMLRNFVHDSQARNDRLGIRLFRLLRAAARQAAEADMLEIAGGDARVTSGTILRASRSTIASPDVNLCSRLAEIVLRWNDELLCDLVAAPSRQVPAVVARLRDLLAGLAAEGIHAFRFGDLVAAVRFDVRRRWAALFEADQGQVAWEDEDAPEGWRQLCRAVEPEAEERIVAEDHFRHLIDCVARHIDAMPAVEDTRGYLYRLWGFLCAFATDQAPEVPGEHAGRLPSRRKLARFLGLPRDRFAGLLETLRGFLTHCRNGDVLEREAAP